MRFYRVPRSLRRLVRSPRVWEMSYTRGGDRIFPTGGIHKFGNDQWEAYVTGTPASRERNLGILAETSRRLGITEES